LQYALDSVTRDVAVGDVFHIKQGTSEVLAAGLGLSSYGSPSVGAPLAFRGYLASAGDGGVGVIDGDGAYSLFASSGTQGVVLRDLRITNTGASVPILENAVTCVNVRVD